MARMSLETAIRLSAEVKGGGNITKVQRSLQDLAQGSRTTARDMQTLRAATFQYARANDTTIAGIRNSITAFRGLQEQAKIGSREFQRYGSEIQKLEGKLRGLDGTAEKAGRSLGQNLAAGLAAAGIGRAMQGITMQAGKFDAELRKAAAIEGGAGSFDVLRKEIEAVAAAAAGTPTEVAELATALSRAGFSAKETAEALAGIVRGAEATSVTFAEMGSIAADNLRAFGLQTNETARVVDVLTQTANKSNQTVLDLGESMKYAAPIARSLGVPMEDLAAVMGLLANNGIRGSDAGTALRTGLTRLQIAAGGADSEISDLTRGNAQLTKAMSTLGSEILDTNGKLRPLDQVLKGLKQSLSGLSATDQAILAKALFGTEAGSKFQALLNSTEGQVSQMFAAIRDSGGVAEKTQKQMQGFDYSVKVLGGNFEYLTNQIGGAIGLVLKLFVDVLNAAIGAAQNLPGPIKAIGAAAAAAATATLGLVAAAAALKAGLAVIGITGVVTALKGLVGVSVAARVQMLALNATVLLNPWVALAAGIGAATYALATYRSESEKIGGKAATGDAGGLAAAQQRITAKQQEISALEGQRPGPRSSRGGDLARARVELAQLQRDVQTGRRAAGGGVVPAAPVLPNAMGTPIGATVGGGGGGSKGDADSLAKKAAKAREDAARKTREQKEASGELLVSERNRLEILQESDPMQRTVIESMIKELEIQSEYEKKLKEARSVREKENLQLAQQYAIRSNTLELERELSDLTKDAQKPLQDALTEAGNRLAYEREYGELLSKGINPELAKQFVELDRIAAAAKTNLELQVATLEARAAELPVASEIRKELERQIELRKEQLKLIPGTVVETKGIMTATSTASKGTPTKDITARIGVLKDEIKGLTDIGQVAITSADNIGNAFGSAFSGLISGAMSAREALAGFFKDVAAGFIEMAAQIIAKQMTMIVLQTILQALNAVSGASSVGKSATNYGGAPGVKFNPGAFKMPALAANGATFGNGIAEFANGGTFTNSIVSSPTLFKFAAGGTMQTGVMGEAGPEAIMPLKRGPGGRLGVDASGMAVPYQRSAASAAAAPAMEVPYQRSGPTMAVPFQKAAGGAAGGSMDTTIDVKFETVSIGGVDYVTRDEAEQIGRQSAERGAELAHKRYRNSPSARRAVGMG